MKAYLLGVVTPFAVALALCVVASIIEWTTWWFQDEAKRMGRKGVGHVADYHDPDNGKWYPDGLHYHSWPGSTPWWICHRLDPLRRWWCLNRPQSEHREAVDRPSSSPEVPE